jgi:DNA-binding transcriptional ArsR family regulator
VRAADRLALAAAQAVLEHLRDRADVVLLEDERLVPDEREGGRVGVAQVRALEELAAIEVPLGIDAALVLREGRELLRREVFDLGDADAVLARDDAAQRARELP